MGLPEILDVARNYAAMVRVQGPDPKGLKMRKHAFHHYHSGKTTLSSSGMVLPGTLRFTPRAWQTQGDDDRQWLPGSALVVTVASIIEPFLSQHYRQNISQAKPELIPGVQIDIMAEDLEGRMGEQYEAQGSDKGAPHWLSAQLLTLVDVPVSSIALQSLVESSSGSLEHGWEVGWSLATSSDGPQPFMDAIRTQNQRQTVGGDTSSPSLMCMSTTRIAILGIPSRFVKDLPNLNMLPSNKRGDLLLAIGSPFGILSPLHFFNSISVGSISNCYPRNSSKKSLLMADVRCLPGMEGAPVFGEQAQLIGLLTKPLRRKGSDAEIQLVIPWEAIATACSDLLQEEPKNAWKETYCNSGTLNAVGKTCRSNSFDLDGYANQFHEHHDSGSPPSPVEKAMASICLVTVDNGVWASGVLLNSQGLILTNAHLLEPWRFGKSPAKGLRYETKSELLSIRSNEYVPPGHEGVGDLQRSQSLLPRRPKTADSLVVDDHILYKFSSTNINHRRIRVRLDHVEPWIWCDAKVVFVAKGPLDIALLQLQYVPDQLCPVIMDFTCPRPGSKAYVIGHGLFGPRCDSSPSICVGVVAKVVEAKRPVSYQSGLQENVGGHFPAMLETTAAVHPGGSGGAIVNSVGHMIGLVTSNARHGGGSVIPHLNFSIPCAALEPIFKFSKDMGDLSLLEDLDRPDKDLSAVWALMPPLSPKPGPPLPSLPKSAPGDTDKDGKGSRFAKFIAERHEGLNKATDLGRVEQLSSKSIPSKL